MHISPIPPSDAEGFLSMLRWQARAKKREIWEKKAPATLTCEMDRRDWILDTGAQQRLYRWEHTVSGYRKMLEFAGAYQNHPQLQLKMLSWILTKPENRERQRSLTEYQFETARRGNKMSWGVATAALAAACVQPKFLTAGLPGGGLRAVRAVAAGAGLAACWYAHVMQDAITSAEADWLLADVPLEG